MCKTNRHKSMCKVHDRRLDSTICHYNAIPQTRFGYVACPKRIGMVCMLRFNSCGFRSLHGVRGLFKKPIISQLLNVLPVLCGTHTFLGLLCSQELNMSLVDGVSQTEPLHSLISCPFQN